MTRIGLLLMVLIGVPGAAAAQAPGCDRACLRATLDQFLTAAIAHDPSRAPLAPEFRQTENAHVTTAGGGVWKTIGALGDTQRRFFDPVTGNALYFGTIREGAATAIASVRVHVEGRRVTEAEWQIVRATDAGLNGEVGKTPFDLARLARTPPVQRVVPKADRVSRATMIALANRYFDGVTAHDGRDVPAEPGCARLENGLEMTGKPLKDDKDIGFDGRSDCRSGYSIHEIANVAARRFLVVDEDAQVIAASAVFLRVPTSTKRRNYFIELFTIDKGRISLIHSAMMYPDPVMPVPNWPPYDGNFPLGR